MADWLSLEWVLENGRGTERPFKCQVHDDRHASASVNVDKGVWVCFACHASGAMKDHVPAPDAAIRILLGETPARLLPESWLDLFDGGEGLIQEPSPYWADRYGTAVACANRCGTDFWTGMPTYPMRDAHGNLLGVVVRDEAGRPKYRYPGGTRTSACLYGTPPDLASAFVDVLVLVEGASSKMAIEQAGPPANWVVAGCYGAGLHAPQVELVKQLDPKYVVLAFDDDAAGQRATALGIKQLLDVVPTLSVRWSTVGGADPGEVAVPQRLEGIRQVLRETPAASLA